MGLGRGVVFGAIWGAIWGAMLSAVLLVVLSLAAPAPQLALAPSEPATAPTPAPQAATDIAPALAAPSAAEDGPALPEPMPVAPDLPSDLGAAPQSPGGTGAPRARVDAPVASDTVPEAAADLAPADRAATDRAAAQEPEAAADAAAGPAAPSVRSPDPAAAPSDPGPSDPVASDPVASVVATPYGTEFAREAPDVSPALPGTEPAPAAAPAPRPAEAAPEPGATAMLDAAPAPQPSASAAPAAPTIPAAPESAGAPAPAPSAPARPGASAPGLAQPLPQRGAEPALPAAPTADSAESPAATSDPAPAPAAIPQPGFAQAPGIRLNQLPKIGDIALPGPLPGTAPPADLAPEAEPGSLPALVAHAAAFQAAPEAPLLAMVLIDDRSGPGIAPDLLADLPFPVTIAIDPAAPGAAEAARAYRAAGQEVAILAALPRGATPSDLEVSWQAFVQTLPEAVAVMDAPEARLQNDRRLAEQLVLLAGEAGHGLLTWDQGLNPAAQLASAASVPQAQVYRRLDAQNEAAPVIGRYLDRAAFEASRTGAIVVTASTRPETLAALLDWAVGQSRTVTLAPLSAVLMRDF